MLVVNTQGEVKKLGFNSGKMYAYLPKIFEIIKGIFPISTFQNSYPLVIVILKDITKFIRMIQRVWCLTIYTFRGIDFLK